MYSGFFIFVICASGLCNVASLPMEPQPWLSLVAQLLERMVRTEFNVDTMHKEMLLAREQVTSGLTQMNDMKETVGSLHKEMQQSHEQVTSGIISQMDDMKETVGSLQTHVKDNVNKSEAVVAFNANTVVDKSPATGQVIIFNQPLFNIGDAYDSGTGIFTAPVSGVYFFSAHFCIENNKSWYYALVKEKNVEFVRGRKHNGEADRCDTASAVVVLMKNERLWVECKSGSTADIFREDSSFKNTFSGALIHRIDEYP